MQENLKKEIEGKIIDCISTGVTGRLIIFKPENNKFGADLAVERRGKYKENAMYLKVISFTGHEENDEIENSFLYENFIAEKNFFILFVYFNEVKQKLHNFIWLIPSIQFKNLAQNINLSDGKNYLQFKASLNPEIKNIFSKYIIKSDELGKMFFKAFENKGEFQFSGASLDEKKSVIIDELKEFLFEARRNTFASNNQPIDNPRLLTSIQLEFQKGNYFYRDIHFSGNKKNAGQEIIYSGLKPIWGMNYFGDSIGKTETAFLQESLLNLSEKCRMGGNCDYDRHDMKYIDNGQGSIENFSGNEEIIRSGKEIYKLYYQGGLISDEI